MINNIKMQSVIPFCLHSLLFVFFLNKKKGGFAHVSKLLTNKEPFKPTYTYDI